MQKESNFKVFKHNDELVTIIKSEIEENYLIIKPFKTVSYKEYKKMKINKNNSKDIVIMDEFGRIALQKNIGIN